MAELNVFLVFLLALYTVQAFPAALREAKAGQAVDLRHPTPAQSLNPFTLIKRADEHTSEKFRRAKEPRSIRAIEKKTTESSADSTTQYVVLLKTDIPTSVDSVLSQISLSPEAENVNRVFNSSAMRGFSATITRLQAERLESLDSVAIVEQSREVQVSSTVVRGLAPWNLQRISTSNIVLGNPSTLDYFYVYDDARPLGAGVDVYIVDSGIYTEHAAFSGRARNIFPDSSVTDDFGHGTHVAGIVGASYFGVSDQVNLLGLKALDSQGAGTLADVVAAIDFAIAQHDARSTEPDFVGSILNLSFSLTEVDFTGMPSKDSRLLTMASTSAVAAGLHVVVAAGNYHVDACQDSPAASGGVGGPLISVGSFSQADTVSTFSNFGPCIDVYAPGENVLSTWIGGEYFMRLESGTSMAAPHVAGLAAYLMSDNATLAASPQLMKAQIQRMALLMTNDAWLGDFATEEYLVNNGYRGAIEYRK